MKRVKCSFFIVALCCVALLPTVTKAADSQQEERLIESTLALGSSNTFAPYAPAPATGDLANLLNEVLMNKMFPEILKEMNQVTDKLGYLVGDTLTLVLPRHLFEVNAAVPTKFTTVGSSKNGFQGKIQLTNFTIVTGASFSAQVNYLSSGEVQVLLKRIKHLGTNGGVSFNGQATYDIKYYLDSTITSGLNPVPVGSYNGTNEKIVGPVSILQPAIADIPDFIVEANEHPRILTLGEKFDMTDPFTYIKVLSSPGQPTAKYSTEKEYIPDTSRMGKTKALVIVTDVYTRKREVPLEFTVVDNIIGQAIPQELPLGAQVKDFPFHDWVKDVYFEQSKTPLTLGEVGE